MSSGSPSIGGSPLPKKSLGQHWLRDTATLGAIADCADLAPEDTILEIGPGLGTLTQVLVARAKHVVAVEFDPELAAELTAQMLAKTEVMRADFLQFDLSLMPPGYKIIGNIPYYITGKIVQKILTVTNKPAIAVLLVQKEVAERIAAAPGKMSILSVAAQYYADVELGPIAPAAKFTPPPKVDSQVIILHPRNAKPDPALDEKAFFRIVKAGFSQRRKKLHTALAGGLHLSVDDAKKWLHTAGIDSNLRAQDLGLADWKKLVIQYPYGN